MPNTLAYIVLFAWPLVVVVLFLRLPLPKALIWSLLGAYLFLPEDTAINLPVLPTWNKVLAASLPAAIMCLIMTRRRGPAPRDRRQERAPARAGRVALPRASVWGRLVTALAVALLVVPILTMLTNTTPNIVGGRYLPGLTLYDAGAMVMKAAISLLPFFLARRHLATREAQIMLLRALVWGALAYSLLMLIEIRLSPQLHRWVYGFHAHQFVQHIRGGDYRPMVFLQHGLKVGIFIAMACLAAAALFQVVRENAVNETDAPGRARKRPAPAQAPRWALAALWLFVILVLSKNLGAFLITVMLLPVALILGLRLRVLVAGALAGMVLFYPMLRGAGVVPVEQVYQMVRMINADRADSFRFRLDNEDRLLAHANEKPLFGWGIWGRSRVYDPVTGADISTTDGAWVIIMGTGGWSTYLARFGLLVVPIAMLALRRRRAGLDAVSGGLALVLAANLVDMIPNASISPVSWLAAGALMGRGERALSRREEDNEETDTASSSPSVRRHRRASRPGNLRA